MKPNPERNWVVQFYGDKEDEYVCVRHRGTIESVLAKADESECEIDWQVLRVTVAALG